MSTPTIGLALGSGGARGLAHIPMLEVFDELGIRPSIVAGASIGAIIGAPYCAGISEGFAANLLSEIKGPCPRPWPSWSHARAAGIFDILKGEGKLFTPRWSEKLLDILLARGVSGIIFSKSSRSAPSSPRRISFRRRGRDSMQGPLRPAVARDHLRSPGCGQADTAI